MLTTERLILREMREDDAKALSKYQSNSSYLAHYATSPDADAIVASAIEWAIEKPRINYQFAVVLAASNSVVGCTGLRQRDYPSGEAEIGIEVNPTYWRRGFAREVLRELISFGVSKLGVTSFWGCTARSNHAAQALVEEFGFTCFDETSDTIRMRFCADE